MPPWSSSTPKAIAMCLSTGAHVKTKKYKIPSTEVHSKSFFTESLSVSQLREYEPGSLEPDYQACYLLIMRFTKHVHFTKPLPNSLHKDHVARLASNYWITEQVVGVPCLVLCSHDGVYFTAEIKVDQPELSQVQFHIEARCAANLSIKVAVWCSGRETRDLLVFSDVLASSPT